MGMDIYSHSGVVVTANQMVAIVSDKNRKRACRLLLTHTATLLHSLRIDQFYSELSECERRQTQRQAGMLTKAFRSLHVDSSAEDIRSMLRSLNKFAESQDAIDEQRDVMEIWRMLINELHPDAPSPEATEFISSPRHQGWDLPPGELLLVFTKSDCYEQVKTKAGRVLDEMLGEKTHLSSWTSYSV